MSGSSPPENRTAQLFEPDTPQDLATELTASTRARTSRAPAFLFSYVSVKYRAYKYKIVYRVWGLGFARWNLGHAANWYCPCQDFIRKLLVVLVGS